MTVKSVKKYIPKKLRPYIIGEIVIWKNDSEAYHNIDVMFRFEDNSEAYFIAYGVRELKWACKKVLSGKRDNIL